MPSKPEKAPAASPTVRSFLRSLGYGAAVAVLVALLSLLLTNYYRSEATILPTDNKAAGGLGQLSAVAANLGIGGLGSDSADASYVEIVNSRWMREELANTPFSFHELHGIKKKVLFFNETLAQYLKADDPESANKMVAGIFSGVRDNKTKVLTLSAETRSPELSQQIVARALVLLEKFVIEKASAKGSAKATFATARLKEARAEADLAAGEYGGFVQNNRAYLTSMDPNVRIEGSRLEAELRLHQQLVMTIALSREQALMESKNDIPVLNVLDHANLPIRHSSPSRAKLVAFALFLVALGCWSWENREWIKSKFNDSEDLAKG